MGSIRNRTIQSSFWPVQIISWAGGCSSGDVAAESLSWVLGRADRRSFVMETLYDLLGALPDDGADDLRAAFRSAVKRAHPDVNPGDPDAELKLRRILRANEILSDVEQ